jgi:hypothetical protein
VGISFFIQDASNLRHTAVHHVRGSHHVRSGLGVGKSLPGQKLEGRVVVHLIAFQHSAMAVGRVFTQTHVGDEDDILHFFLNGPQSPLDYTVRIVSRGAGFVLGFGQSEQDYGRDTQVFDLGDFPDEFVHGKMVLTRHGADWVSNSFTGSHEKGVNKIVNG